MTITTPHRLAAAAALWVGLAGAAVAQEVRQAPLPATPGGEHYAPNLGIYYRLEPYGSAYGARIARPPAPATPAGLLRLETGDLIVALDDLPIYGPADVLNHYAQTSVRFVNIRDGQLVTNWVNLPAVPGPGPGPPVPPFPPGPTPPSYTLGVVTSPTVVGSVPVPGQGTTVLRPIYGLRIDQVVPGSAAQSRGLEVGDVILSANGQPMSDSQALRRAIAGSGGVLNLVLRDVRNPAQPIAVTIYLQPIGGGVAASPAPAP